MTKTSPADFFTQDLARAYDERNRQLSSISENMHFLIRLILQDLPTHSRILCVGVGTGAEILSLSKIFPHFTFVGVDPSSAMLDVCRERLKNSGILERCTLIHGYIHDVPKNEPFDAALSILVAHFIQREDRIIFFREIYNRLKKTRPLDKHGNQLRFKLCGFPIDAEKLGESANSDGRHPRITGQSAHAAPRDISSSSSRRHRIDHRTSRFLDACVLFKSLYDCWLAQPKNLRHKLKKTTCQK